MSPFRHTGPEEPAPYLLRRHPEGLEKTRFRVEFIPMKIGARMATFFKPFVHGQIVIAESGGEPMLEITEVAANQFKKILSETDAKGSPIRIFISGGGCCASYGLDVTEKGEDGDLIIEKENLKIYVEPAAYEALSQATLDYKNGSMIKGMPSCCG